MVTRLLYSLEIGQKTKNFNWFFSTLEKKILKFSNVVCITTERTLKLSIIQPNPMIFFWQLILRVKKNKKLKHTRIQSSPLLVSQVIIKDSVFSEMAMFYQGEKVFFFVSFIKRFCAGSGKFHCAFGLPCRRYVMPK